MSKAIFNAIFCGALFVTGLPTSWGQNSSLPLCASEVGKMTRKQDWHMCRHKEDLGGGVVIDHEYRNGVPYFASGRQYPEGTFSLVDKFSLSNELNAGPIDMRGGRVYIDLAGLNVNGTKRIFGVLFDLPGGYAMSSITSMKSFLVKMTADCSAQKMLPVEISGFYGVMGEGDPTPMELPFESIAMTDLEKFDPGVAKSDLVRVFKSVMGSVCAADIITQVNNARNGRQRIETQSNLPACPSSGYFHNCFGTYNFASGNKYVGEWRDNESNGQGTLAWANGNKYVGEHKDGKRNGPGIFYLANGSISQSGVWSDGKLVKSQYVDPNSFTRIAKDNSGPSAVEAQRQENERKAAQLVEDRKRLEEDKRQTELARLRAEAEEAKRRQAQAEAQRQENERKAAQMEEDRKRIEEDKRQIALERQRIESQKGQPQVAPDNRRRLALVIGNDNYSSMPRLNNAVNDARSMSDALRQANFEVMSFSNLDKRRMEEALRNFTGKLGRDDVGLFYYSGHGIQADNRNFLIPVGENVKKTSDVSYEGVDVNRVMDNLRDAKNALNIVVLDACRSSLPDVRGGMSRGLTVTDAPQGSIIAYATSPGKTASDGDGGNSPYTKNLIKAMQRKGVKIEEVFKEVRQSVIRDTNGEQTPSETSYLVGDFYFRP